MGIVAKGWERRHCILSTHLLILFYMYIYMRRIFLLDGCRACTREAAYLLSHLTLPPPLFEKENCPLSRCSTDLNCKVSFLKELDQVFIMAIPSAPWKKTACPEPQMNSKLLSISTVDQLVWWNLVLQTQGRAQPVRTAPFLLPAFNVRGVNWLKVSCCRSLKVSRDQQC